MPVYQYACKDCGESLEVRQSFSDASLTECPACGGDLRKVFNAVGVVFKGSGFYRNDSRGSSTSTDSPSKSDSSTSSNDTAPSGDGASPSAASSAPTPTPAA